MKDREERGRGELWGRRLPARRDRRDFSGGGGGEARRVRERDESDGDRRELFSERDRDREKGERGRVLLFSECIAERTREEVSLLECIIVCVCVGVSSALNIIMANETNTHTTKHLSFFGFVYVRWHVK